jgi:hypothetical protein
VGGERGECRCVREMESVGTAHGNHKSIFLCLLRLLRCIHARVSVYARAHHTNTTCKMRRGGKQGRELSRGGRCEGEGR